MTLSFLVTYEALAVCAYARYNFYVNLVKGNYPLVSNLVTFPLSFLVPTVCRLPPQTIALIVMGAIALVITIVGTIFTIFHWLSHFYDKGESVAPL